MGQGLHKSLFNNKNFINNPDSWVKSESESIKRRDISVEKLTQGILLNAFRNIHKITKISYTVTRVAWQPC